jgi:hypothetical protein
VLDVDSHVEAAVIPVGVVIAAPLPVSLEAINGMSNLWTVLAVLCRFPVDSSPIGLESPMARLGIIWPGRCGEGQRKCQTYCERGTQNEPNGSFSHRLSSSNSLV